MTEDRPPITTEELVRRYFDAIKQLKEANDAVRDLTKTVSQMSKANAELAKTIEDLRNTIASLERTIEELKSRRNKNSSNSSKPPSSDGLGKPTAEESKKKRSLRTSSGKKQGGQDNHPGSNLQRMEATNTVDLMPKQCQGCPMYDTCRGKYCTASSEIRQVIDIIIKATATDYRLCEIPACPMTGQSLKGEFPEAVKAYVQYGNNLKALVVALNTVGDVSINRTHEILSGIFNIPISTGTIASMVSRCAANVTDIDDYIRSQIAMADLAHFDETGTRAEGHTYWVHTACNASYTYLYFSRKRGQKGMNEGNVLPNFNGTAVHDCWQPYWHYNVRHAICCVHLLRELKGVEDNYKEQTWEKRFSKLLLKMKATKEKLIEKGQAVASYYFRHKFSQEYDEIIEQAYGENPEPPSDPHKRGRKKRGKVLSLIDRLKKFKSSVCLFFEDFQIPFDNNLAEQSIRIVKVKTKVSGCFRTADGAREYLKIMTYVGTAKKQGHSTFEAIQHAVFGDPEILIK